MDLLGVATSRSECSQENHIVVTNYLLRWFGFVKNLGEKLSGKRHKCKGNKVQKPNT